MTLSSLRIPLKYKFLAVLLAIMVTSLSVFFYFANRIFSEDKKLFVLDLNLTLLRAATSEINVELKSRLDQLQLLIPRVYQPAQNLPTDPFQGLASTLSDEVLGVTFFRQDESKKNVLVMSRYENQALFAKRQLPKEVVQEINKKHPLGLRAIFDKPDLDIVNRSIRMVSATQNIELSVVTFLIPGTYIDADSRGVVIAVDMIQDFLRKKLQQSEMAEMFLITGNGNILSHAQLTPTVEYASTVFPHPIVQRLQGKHFPRESLELIVDGEPYLCNMSDTGFHGIFAVSQIKRNEAFAALKMLQEKSTLIAAMIFFAAIIVSILFAGRLTSNIEKLRIAAKEIGSGDLDVKLDIHSNDEIQSVAESFTWMSNRIRQLITEQVTKARMERELETARLVQSTLLTTPHVSTDSVDISAYYVPATECGGDFWDAHLSNNRLTVFIGDATGHGAPAAIVTAVAKSCFSTINAIYEEEPLTPEQFLVILNFIIHSACQGKLLMTMCVMQLDLQTGDLAVCNAGHEPPLRLRANPIIGTSQRADKKRKSSAEVLFCRGERLGFTQTATYEAEHYKMERGDTILLYTDGISEAHNMEGKEWGERALKKAFAQNGIRPTSVLKNQLIKGVTDHTSGAPQDDDITFVLISWKGSSTITTSESNEGTGKTGDPSDSEAA